MQVEPGASLLGDEVQRIWERRCSGQTAHGERLRSLWGAARRGSGLALPTSILRRDSRRASCESGSRSRHPPGMDRYCPD